MIRKKLTLLVLFIFCFSALAVGCGTATEEESQVAPVVIEKQGEIFYRVDIDMTSLSHQEMGRAYALAIREAFPAYEEHVDSMLQDQFDALAMFRDKIGYDLDLALCLTRAQALFPNLQPEYQEEIQGMLEVFDYQQDTLGDGHLSQNEMLVLQLFGDVMRPTQCSGVAAFGDNTVTGQTILGRNLDWDLLPHEDASLLHSVAVLHNGDKSIAMIGILGTLVPFSGFNDDNVFIACLDAETNAPYPDIKEQKSYLFDFRYALENEQTLEAVADFLVSRPYLFNHVALLADPDKAKVLENDLGSPGRGLRSWDSVLHPGIKWEIKDAIAVVNDFRLPDNFMLAPEDDPIDAVRWDTYTREIEAATANGGKIDTDTMKKIVGFSGTDGKPLPSGAVFRTDHVATLQSVVVSMDDLATYVAFKPYKEAPMTPTYTQVFASSPF